MGVSRYFNVVNPPKLIEDLEDPFINQALTSVCCELYYKQGSGKPKFFRSRTEI